MRPRNGLSLSYPRFVILRNSGRCRLCGRVLVSRFRHEMDGCACGAAVDGGLDYQRRTGPVESTLVVVEVADPDQERRAVQVQRSITAAYRRGESPSDETLRAAVAYRDLTMSDSYVRGVGSCASMRSSCPSVLPDPACSVAR